VGPARRARPPRGRAAARPALRDSQLAGVAEDLDAIVARRVAFLTDYQNARFAAAYRARVEHVAAREQEVAPGSTRLASAVARYYFKLLAVKDEYEVARLYTDGSFRRQLEAEFEGDYRLYVHFAPPFTIPVIDWLTERRDPDTGRMKKWRIPASWFLPVLSVMARFKFLRGTPLNIVGMTAHRASSRRSAASTKPRSTGCSRSSASATWTSQSRSRACPSTSAASSRCARRTSRRCARSRKSCSPPTNCTAEGRMSRTIFSNANLLDGERPARAGITVVVEGERIAAVVGPGDAPIPAASARDRVVDLAGKTLLPGLILSPLPLDLPRHHDHARAARDREAAWISDARRRGQRAARAARGLHRASCRRAS
jgi:hypothetical protein